MYSCPASDRCPRLYGREIDAPSPTRAHNDSTFADISDSRQGVVHIVSSTPYARRLYYHPEFHFSQDENVMAGAGWFEPYKNGGNKFNSVLDWFQKFMKF